MISAPQKAHIRPVHPFPARMAPSIVWDALAETDNPLSILDPMAGSGTTLVHARARGHRAIGCDTDPLALLIAQAWCSDAESERLKHRAYHVLERAKQFSADMKHEDLYPRNSDDETRRFIDFWFDVENCRELAALAKCISRIRSASERILLWCAFSRLIITKSAGASLAMDVSHGRPHKTYTVAPVKPFDAFTRAVEHVVDNCPFSDDRNSAPPADIRYGDARTLPVLPASVDMIITSPPYLNAIDYLRGHKLSLVWMGHNISELRALRSGNIGTEVAERSISKNSLEEVMQSMANLEILDDRRVGMIRRYVSDMEKVMKECARVLKKRGRAVFVVGDSAIYGVFVKNSEGLAQLAVRHGLSLISCTTRPLERKRRYLPPPESRKAGSKMQKRMREEVILQFIKA